MSKQVYISADYAEDDGDREVEKYSYIKEVLGF